MFATETKTLKNGRSLPVPVIAAVLNTIVQILAENPLVLHRLHPLAGKCLRDALPTYDFCYLWFTGIVDDDGYLKKDFRDVFQCAVSADTDGLIIADPVN